MYPVQICIVEIKASLILDIKRQRMGRRNYRKKNCEIKDTLGTNQKIFVFKLYCINIILEVSSFQDANYCVKSSWVPKQYHFAGRLYFTGLAFTSSLFKHINMFLLVQAYDHKCTSVVRKCPYHMHATQTKSMATRTHTLKYPWCMPPIIKMTVNTLLSVAVLTLSIQKAVMHITLTISPGNKHLQLRSY
jgi:hypothetical protein